MNSEWSLLDWLAVIAAIGYHIVMPGIIYFGILPEVYFQLGRLMAERIKEIKNNNLNSSQ